MAFLLYISCMKSKMIIVIGLCSIAMLNNVASANAKAAVPKNEVVIGPSGLELCPSMEMVMTSPVIFIDHQYFITDVLNEPSASIVVLKMNYDAEISAPISVEGKNKNIHVDPGSCYKSPNVDLSYIWKYQHFHSC